MIAQTKLPSYLFIIAPIGFICIAVAANHLFDLVQSNLVCGFGIIVLVYFTFQPFSSYNIRINNPARENLIHNTNIYKNVGALLPPEFKTVINVVGFQDIDIMFYNDDITAYHWWINIM